jgi:DNA-binding transcriptional regulator PaaX
MSNNDTTRAIIDGLLKFTLTSSAIATTLVIPNAIQALDKPLNHYLDYLDKRARERELRRLGSYMKKQGLVTGSYEHGLSITKAGRKRAEKADFDNLSIAKPEKWDKKWRLVLFDIPEQHKKGRDYLTHKLKTLGFQQLQQSVWIYPFQCRKEVETVSITFGVSRYVTYIATSHIDHQNKLTDRFSKTLKYT